MAKARKDPTEVIRVRESVARNKHVLLIYAVLAICGIVGWITTL